MDGKGEAKNPPEDMDDEPNVVRSPLFKNVKEVEIPDASITSMLFQALDEKMELLKEKVWVVDVENGTSYYFRDIQPMSKKIASALSRMGFKKGDVLFYSAYDSALVLMVQIGVLLCGGAMRGSYPMETKEGIEQQMKEVSAHHVLCDHETANHVKWAAGRLDWDVKIFSIGKRVEDAISIEEMIEKEDCSSFPVNVKINPREDTLLIVNTSGSSGEPKGVIHFHSSRMMIFSCSPEVKRLRGTYMVTSGNFSLSLLAIALSSIFHGYTIFSIFRYDQNFLVASILKYKPQLLFVNPVIMNLLANYADSNEHDLSFLKLVVCSGSVLNISTLKKFAAKLPSIQISHIYAMSETMSLARTPLSEATEATNADEFYISGVKVKVFEGGEHVSCGVLEQMVECKIMDPVRGCSVGRNNKGKIIVRVPYMMKGYLNNKTEKGFDPAVDEHGWFDTGDFGFFDDDGYLYVIDRCSSSFYYYSHWVHPSVVEGIILDHPAVFSCCVVGAPNPEAGAVARAYVVLQPGSKSTEEEIKLYVAGKCDPHMHLHGGVVFLERLPRISGLKLDRPGLQRRAIAELKSTVDI